MFISGGTSSFFDGFDEDAETTIYKTTTQLKNLDEQLINGEIHISEYAKQKRKPSARKRKRAKNGEKRRIKSIN